MPSPADGGCLQPSVRWTLWGTLPVLAYGIWLRSVDLNPESLWLDDAWVAALTKAPGLGSLLEHGSSSPPGFTLIVAACARLCPDPEVGAQLFPFLCGLLAIPVVAWAGLLLTRSPACAVFAAALYACNPFAVIYAARVKQYSSDTLLAALALAGFCLLLQGYSRRRLWLFAGALLVGLCVSSVALFVVAALLPVAAWHVYKGAPASEGALHPLLAGGGVLALALVIYVGFVRGSVNPALDAWWRGHYLPTDSLSAFLATTGRALALWPAQAMHDLPPLPMGPGLPPPLASALPGIRWLGVLLALGGAIALWRRNQRAHLLALFLLALIVVAASAAKRFPLGTNRVELFLSPFVACLMASGLSLAGRRAQREGPPVPADPMGEAHSSQPSLRKIAAGLGVALVVLPAARRPLYPELGQVTAGIVASVADEHQPGDGLWVGLHDTFGLAYYGPWDVTLQADPRLGCGFHPALQLTGFAVLEGDLLADPASWPQRVFVVFARRGEPGFRRSVHDALSAQGYRAQVRAAEVSRPGGCAVLRFDREG